MSLVEVDEATEIIHEAAGEEANVILGAVVDDHMEDDEIMVTVIATGFNKRGSGTTLGLRPAKIIKPMERVPTGVDELQKLDVPAYIRRGVDLSPMSGRPEDHMVDRPKIDKNDPEKPAFLRKIMD